MKRVFAYTVPNSKFLKALYPGYINVSKDEKENTFQIIVRDTMLDHWTGAQGVIVLSADDAVCMAKDILATVPEEER